MPTPGCSLTARSNATTGVGFSVNVSGSLPAEQALLIELVYYRDKSIKEVALLMGIPENTVKSRMFLGRKKLAAMLNAATAVDDSIPLVPAAAAAPAVPAREPPRQTRRSSVPATGRLALA